MSFVVANCDRKSVIVLFSVCFAVAICDIKIFAPSLWLGLEVTICDFQLAVCSELLKFVISVVPTTEFVKNGDGSEFLTA